MSASLESGFDPGSRELCPDGMCLGVIGTNGRCKVCGKASPSSPTPRLAVSGAPVEMEAAPAAPAPAVPQPPVAVEAEDFDPARRELCPDGMCLGVIGVDGRCKACGKPRGG
jgi:hypothetical protein